jgi:hypothetical protein
MQKAEVQRLLRESLDPTVRDLGFRWRRMSRSTEGWYVRVWDGGRDTLGWGIASYSPRCNIGGFATVRIDSVEDLITPHIPYAWPEAAQEAWTCNVTDLLAFVDGPALRQGENMARAKRMVETEEDVRAFADWLTRTVLEHIEPWWRSMRTPEALWQAEPSWQRFWPQPQLTELALAFLCAPPDVQQRLEDERVTSSRTWPEMERKKIDGLVADLRARRSASR